MIDPKSKPSGAGIKVVKSNRLDASTMTWTNSDGTIIPASNASPCDEPNVLVGGTRIRTHRAERCHGYWCCIHNPSPHHMRAWDQYWDSMSAIMFRVCTHGTMHPDPDDPSALKISMNHRATCDGCCHPSNHIRRVKRT